MPENVACWQTRMAGRTPQCMLGLVRLAIAMLLILSIGGAIALAVDPSAAEVKAAFPAGDGLAVQVGATDAEFLGSLTNGGTRLVHGLAMDDQTRDKVRAALISAGRHPMASVATWHGAPLLPYADRLVNLLIVDRDALAARAPPERECRRVVAPGGAILTLTGGKWMHESVTQPAGFADWTHFDGGPDGNAVSADAEATGLCNLQWIDNAREPRWMKTGPHGGDQGNIRILGRYAVIDSHIRPMDKDPKFTPRVFLECRDVNNGLLLWRRPRSPDLSPKRWALAVSGGQCFTWLKSDGPLTAIDLATGKELRTYPGSEIKPWPQLGHREGAPRLQAGIHGDNHWVRVVGRTVVANGNGPLQAWSLDGKPLWRFAEEGQRLELPAVDARRGAVYGLMIEDAPVDAWGHGPMMWQRWPNSSCVKSVVALDLATGRKRWENREIASRESMKQDRKGNQVAVRTEFGQLIAAGEYLVLANSDAIGGGHFNVVASLDAATGKTLSYDPRLFQRAQLQFNSYNAVYRDGTVYVMNPSCIVSFNPASGELTRVFNLGWNGRCAKPIATREKFLVGQTAFLDRDFGGEMFALARSGCANSPVPGAGLILFGPHLCSCVTHLDGYFATTSRPAPPPMADAQRLVHGSGVPASLPPAGASAENLISEGWSWFTISAPVDPRTVEKAAWRFQVDPQAHRIDACNGSAQWSYVADARIGADFVVLGRTVVLGSHDGWVHAIDLASGALRWRYLVAPTHRWIIANGMLTSSWPVFGVAERDGLVVASAGTHAELDGGIRVVALRPDDGTVAWEKHLHKTPTRIAPHGEGMGGKRGRPIAEFSLINAAPSVEGGKIVIDGGAHLNRLEFAPEETEEQINARLAAQKRR